MTKLFGDGAWLRFAPLRGFTPEAIPGQTVEFRLASDGPPGLVECAVDGTVGIQGIGEEIPSELTDLLPGYAAWPRGRTIGPVDGIKLLSDVERVKQLLDWIPEFERLGWLTSQTRARYEKSLRFGDLSAVFASRAADLSSGSIAAEVSAVLTGMSRH